MNDKRRIEIFAPFGAALDLTKQILFQPFDIGKWFVIGFAAFLSHLAGGGGGSFNPSGFGNNSKFNWNYRSATQDVFSSTNMPEFSGCVIVGAVVAVLIAIAVLLVCLWIGSRGKFIFADCIVRNRGAIVQPW